MKYRLVASVCLMVILFLVSMSCAKAPTTPAPTTPASTPTPTVPAKTATATPTPTPTPAAPQKVIEWTFADYGSRTESFGPVMVKFASNVEAETGGRMKIKALFGGEYPFKTSEVLSSIQQGLVTGWHTTIGNMSTEVPQTGILALYFLLPTPAQGDVLYDVVSDVVLKAVSDKYNALVASYWWFPPQYYFFRDRVESVEGFRGKKVRVWNTETSELTAALGAVPFTITTAEVYTALQQGTVQGLCTSPMSMIDRKWGEVAKYFYGLDAGAGADSFVISKSAYQALPSDIKEKFDKALAQARKDGTEIGSKNYVELAQKQIGMVYVTPPAGDREKVRKVARDTWYKWADRTPGGRDLMDKALATLEKAK